MDKHPQDLDGLVGMMNMANTGGNSSRKNGLNVTNQDGIRKSFYLG